MDKSVVKKCIKRVAIASVAAVIGMNLFACTKPETDKITIEFDKDLNTNEKKTTENEDSLKGKNGVNGSSQAYSSDEHIEDGWEVGKWGYKEPPMSMRDYSRYNDPNSIEYFPGRYVVTVNSERYGKIDILYDGNTGIRGIYSVEGKDDLNLGTQLMRVSKDVTKSTAELLEDLYRGDKIANSWK